MSNNTKNTKRKIRNLSAEETGFVSAILADKPYISDADIAHALHNNGYARDILVKDLRNKVRYARLKITKEAPAVRTRIQTHKDGSITMNQTETGQNMEHSEQYLDEKLLEDVNLDPSQYALSSYGESEWESANGETLHSTRKKFVRLTQKEIDANNLAQATTRRKAMEIFGNDVKVINENSEKLGGLDKVLGNAYGAFYGATKIDKNPDGKYSVIIPLADLHIGERDAASMVRSYKMTFEKTILPELQEKYFVRSGLVRTIDLACLGDIVHCDNERGETAHGTALQPTTDGYRSFDMAIDFLEWLITTIRETFKVPVRIIYVYGNHDTNLGFGLMRTLAALFKKVDGVSFVVNEKLFHSNEEDDWYQDYEANPEYLWVKYGDVGITYTHGKFCKKNMKNIPEVANPNARRDVLYNAVIYGHLHHLAEGSTDVHQHNYGLSTPNFTRDKFGKGLGCVTNPEFYLFEVNHQTNRVSYTPYPSLPYNKQ